VEGYLAADVIVEPLIDRWYAWIHLLPPATAAFVVVERHLRMMESYVRSPALHAVAAADPSTRSGPFLDLGGDRTGEVAELLDATRACAGAQVELVDAVRRLDRMVAECADGRPLEQLHGAVPEPLQGLVELFHDRHHRADFRFIEPLLYASPLWDTSRHSVRLSRLPADGSRPFVLSTPRLATTAGGEIAVDVPVAFDAPALDDLFRARTEPTDVTELGDRLGFDRGSPAAASFHRLFTPTAPARLPRPAGVPGGRGGRLTYFGHACLLVEAAGSSILIDPVIAYEDPSSPLHAGYADLPDEIDYVLITHGHHDHLLPESLLQIRHRVRTVVVPASGSGNLIDPSLRLAVEHLGFHDVVEVRPFDVIPLPGGAITALPFVGEHHDLDVSAKTCYHLQLAGRTILVAADSANVDPAIFERAHSVVGDAEIVFQGMECVGAPASWVYGPYFSSPLPRDHDQTRRGRASNCGEALDLIERFHASEVYVYAMGVEPWLGHLLGLDHVGASPALAEADRLVASCRHRGRVAERLFGHKELCWR
jgi:L-ascorbate metabolism protein UlaG (beta-lactamase superfamily)